MKGKGILRICNYYMYSPDVCGMVGGGGVKNMTIFVPRLLQSFFRYFKTHVEVALLFERKVGLGLHVEL